jgi:hypothetical protein
MAIVDYQSLQASVANWLHRTDLAAMVPDFISMAEARLSADLNARPMDTASTLTLTAGSSYVLLPPDMLEMRRFVLQTSPLQAMKYITPDQMAVQYPSGTTGRPYAFTVIGANAQFGPTPDQNYTAELVYRQRIPALSSTNTSNWLLQNFPNAYLFAALLEAQPFIQNDERIPVFQQKYQEAIDGINSIDWYSGSTMVVTAG